MAHTPLPDSLQERFLALSCQLSPENLACDGERSRADQRKVRAAIMKEWRALEAEAGRKVTEAEVWRTDLDK